jgi:hypothetical protein
VRGLADRQLRVPKDPLAAANRRISILLPYSKLGDDDPLPAADAPAPTEPAPRTASAKPARAEVPHTAGEDAAHE